LRPLRNPAMRVWERLLFRLLARAARRKEKGEKLSTPTFWDLFPFVFLYILPWVLLFEQRFREPELFRKILEHNATLHALIRELERELYRAREGESWKGDQ